MGNQEQEVDLKEPEMHFKRISMEDSANVRMELSKGYNTETEMSIDIS